MLPLLSTAHATTQTADLAEGRGVEEVLTRRAAAKAEEGAAQLVVADVVASAGVVAFAGVVAALVAAAVSVAPARPAVAFEQAAHAGESAAHLPSGGFLARLALSRTR